MHAFDRWQFFIINKITDKIKYEIISEALQKLAINFKFLTPEEFAQVKQHCNKNTRAKEHFITIFRTLGGLY